MNGVKLGASEKYTSYEKKKKIVALRENTSYIMISYVNLTMNTGKKTAKDFRQSYNFDLVEQFVRSYEYDRSTQ